AELAEAAVALEPVVLADYLCYNILCGGLCKSQNAALSAIRAFVFGTRNCAVPPALHRMVRAFVRE
ncbi:MAG: hypothetical protein ACLQFI_22585, partial [Methylocella sp.]